VSIRDDVYYLIHIDESIARIQAYTQGGRGEFFGSQLIQDAVVRNFEIMGEATKQLSQEFRNANGSIPWRRIAGFRDVLIHNYVNVDYKRVWETIEADLPALKAAISALLPARPDA
jgi:uncharacterized protein with HEPN domain